MKFHLTYFLSAILAIAVKSASAQCPDGAPDNAIYIGSLIGSNPITLSTVDGGDTEIGLWDENGKLLAFRDDIFAGGCEFLSSIKIPLPTGSYVVGGSTFNVEFGENFQVTGPGLSLNQEENYQIEVVNEDEDLLSGAQTIFDLQDTQVEDNPEELAFFCFDVEDSGPFGIVGQNINDILEVIGDRVQASVLDGCPEGAIFIGNIDTEDGNVLITTTDGGDTELGLWDSNGDLIDDDDDGGEGLFSSLLVELDDGLYVIGGSVFNVRFEDDFRVVGDGLEQGDSKNYSVQVVDQSGTTIYGSKEIFDFFGEDVENNPDELALFCFIIGDEDPAEGFSADLNKALDNAGNFFESAGKAIDNFLGIFGF